MKTSKTRFMRLVRRSRPTLNDAVATPMYRKWWSMLARCYNPSHPAFAVYRKRDIHVCARWCGRGGFDNFLNDLGAPPHGMTLGRKDRAKDYSPSNCRWMTGSEQQRGHPGGKRDPNSLSSRARKAGLPYRQVYARIKVLGWPEHKALTTPMGRRGGVSMVERQRKAEMGKAES